jgi:hypothetical protein
VQVQPQISEVEVIAGRRDFIKQTAAMTAGLAGLGMFAEVAAVGSQAGEPGNRHRVQ